MQLQNDPQRNMTGKIEDDILTLPKDKFVKKLPRAGFELAPSGFWSAALPIGISCSIFLVMFL